MGFPTSNHSPRSAAPPENTRNVLLVAPWVDHGGADQVTIDVARDLVASGRSVTCVTTQPSPNRRLAEVHRVGAEVWCLPDLVPPGHIDSSLISLAHDTGADVMHIINSRSGFDVIPSLRELAKCPKVVAHFMGEEGPGQGYPRYAMDLYGDCIDLAIAVSDDLACIIESYGAPPHRTAVIRPSVDVERFRPMAGPERSDHVLEVLLPVRLATEKDPHLALSAIEAARREWPYVRLTIAGDGPMRSELEARVARSSDLASAIRFLGTVMDMPRLYAAADVVLLTSEFEASPLAVCEAMACATPVVAPHVGGIPELIDDDCGICVQARSPEAFAAALLRFRSRDARSAAGSAGRRRALRLIAPERSRQQLIDAYAGLAIAGTGP